MPLNDSVELNKKKKKRMPRNTKDTVFSSESTSRELFGGEVSFVEEERREGDQSHQSKEPQVEAR